MSRRWTQTELDYLEKYWGRKSQYLIAKKLNRTVEGISQKAKSIGLESWQKSVDDITVTELAKCFNMQWNTIIKCWIGKHGLPCRTQKVSERKNIHHIAIDDFWKWANRNKEKVHWERLEENVLGIEPHWVKPLRKELAKEPYRHRWDKTKKESLASDLKLEIFTESELCEKYETNPRALRQMLYRMKIWQRPIGL